MRVFSILIYKTYVLSCHILNIQNIETGNILKSVYMNYYFTMRGLTTSNYQHNMMTHIHVDTYCVCSRCFNLHWRKANWERGSQSISWFLEGNRLPIMTGRTTVSGTHANYYLNRIWNMKITFLSHKAREKQLEKKKVSMFLDVAKILVFSCVLKACFIKLKLKYVFVLH